MNTPYITSLIDMVQVHVDGTENSSPENRLVMPELAWLQSLKYTIND